MKLLSFNDLRTRGISLSRSQINRLIKKGRFPAPARPTGEFGRSCFWSEAEIDEYLTRLFAERGADKEAA